MKYQFDFLDGELWWGGSTLFGCNNPYSKDSVFEHDYRRNAWNQTMPLYLSNKGRYIWSETPFLVRIANGRFELEGTDIVLTEAGSCLKDAYLAAMQAHFPTDGKQLPKEFFRTAQYNTWMEFTYDQTQEGVLDYAHALIDHGFRPGILMIDEGWHGRYGTWEFDFAKFPDPKAMVDELHALGFIVMLWVVPFVCPDGVEFLKSTSKIPGVGISDGERFIRNAKGEVALFSWWNGYSAMLDFNNPADFAFLDDQLQHLIKAYGVDGFKFDGGSYGLYHPENIINGPAKPDMDPIALNKAWNEFGRRYPYHEYKDTFKGGGKNCIQRLCDKFHVWTPNGINTLVPHSILQGLLGHPFICPDMIGGGDWVCPLHPDFVFDEELFVRMAQASALFPMMQFSWAPWRMLNQKHFDIVLDAARLHERLSDELIALVEASEVSGEPILRSLEYDNPHQGYAEIHDEFMLGEDILVAPVVTPQTYERDVVFPSGSWQDENGHIYEGGKTHHLPAPIETLLWFRRVN